MKKPHLSALPSTEQRIRRARTLLRIIWQGYDAAGHSCGRSQTCAFLELALDLIGPADPTESRQADTDVTPLLAEAKAWREKLSAARMEEHFSKMDRADTLAMRRITKEIESGFEDRMR